MKPILVAIQAGTFLPLGWLFITEGNWRFGLAQVCLAIVTALVYL